MQLPQLFRRGVIRPLNEHAAKQLAAFCVDATLRVEWLPVLTDEQFDEIWEAGFLQRINESCGTEISDYEEVELKASAVPIAIQALDIMDHANETVVIFQTCLKELLTDAAKSGSSVYFIF